MIMTAPGHPHPLDHLVLPTARLDVARARLARLGFTVAPTGVHPFGTENCCVYLCRRHVSGAARRWRRVGRRRGHRRRQRVRRRDRAYRDRLGDEGFSAVVFATSDADADHARYIAAGVSAGDRLDFSRPFTDAAGKSDTASFRLAFAAGRDAPDAFLFACERVECAKRRPQRLQAHANGARASSRWWRSATSHRRISGCCGVAARADADGDQLALAERDDHAA